MSFEELERYLPMNEAKSRVYSLYFRAKQTPRNTSLMAPPEYRFSYFTSVAFCRLGCQALSERIELDSVSAENDDDTAYLRDALEANGGLDLMSQAHMAAMEYGRAYLIPSGGDRVDGLPVIQVVTGRDMIHFVDPYTNEVTEALRVYGARRENRAYYSQMGIQYRVPSGPEGWMPDPNAPDVTFDNNEDIPVFPLICRDEIGRPWGRPEAKDVFKLQDAACRVATDMSITSATMATPRTILFGVEKEDFAQHNADGSVVPGTVPTGEQLYTSKLLTVSDASAKLAEASAAQLQNFSTALNSITRQAAAQMGVSQSIFGVASDANPASGDSMRQDDSRQVRRAEQLTRGFERPWKDMFEYLLVGGGRVSLKVTLRWVDPALPNLSSRAAAIFQLAAVVVNGKPLYDWEWMHQLLGDSQVDIEAARIRMEAEDINTLLNQPPPPSQVPTAPPVANGQ